MIRRVPIGATLLVLGAVAIMVALGFWQLGRLHEKEALIEQGERALDNPATVPWPQGKTDTGRVLYRRASVNCTRVLGLTARAGTNVNDRPGWTHVARCSLEGGGVAVIVIGWSQRPDAPQWAGGQVAGIIAPGPRLIAISPVAGLEATALPDPRALPNNHLSYAVQWFLFAVTALVIYALALRRRWATRGS